MMARATFCCCALGSSSSAAWTHRLLPQVQERQAQAEEIPSRWRFRGHSQPLEASQASFAGFVASAADGHHGKTSGKDFEPLVAAHRPSTLRAGRGPASTRGTRLLTCLDAARARGKSERRALDMTSPAQVPRSHCEHKPTSPRRRPFRWLQSAMPPVLRRRPSTSRSGTPPKRRRRARPLQGCPTASPDSGSPLASSQEGGGSLFRRGCKGASLQGCKGAWSIPCGACLPRSCSSTATSVVPPVVQPVVPSFESTIAQRVSCATCPR